jgi:hypothetical protein
VKRAEATKRIEGLLERVAAGEGRYLPRVREVFVFGSYARGALEVGDVDLDVEFDQTQKEAGIWFATLLAGGFDHLGALRQELRGNQRILQIQFKEIEGIRKEGFAPTRLWKRGDSLETAVKRLHEIAADPTASRAERDTVHPLIEPVEKHARAPIDRSSPSYSGPAGLRHSSSSCLTGWRRTELPGAASLGTG